MGLSYLCRFTSAGKTLENREAIGKNREKKEGDVPKESEDFAKTQKRSVQDGENLCDRLGKSSTTVTGGETDIRQKSRHARRVLRQYNRFEKPVQPNMDTAIVANPRLDGSDSVGKESSKGTPTEAMLSPSEETPKKYQPDRVKESVEYIDPQMKINLLLPHPETLYLNTVRPCFLSEIQ